MQCVRQERLAGGQSEMQCVRQERHAGGGQE
jgi:hypothetical protein